MLQPFLQMSNREFKEKFGRISGSWRGKKPIQRNAILALAHFKKEAAVPELIDLLKKNERPVIRGTAAWAIGKIGSEEGRLALVDAMQKEKDEEVLLEIKKGLQFFEEKGIS